MTTTYLLLCHKLELPRVPTGNHDLRDEPSNVLCIPLALLDELQILVRDLRALPDSTGDV